jgi:hypothetical protein
MTATLLHILMAVHTLIGAVSSASLAYLYYAAWKRRRPTKDWILLAALTWPCVNLTLLVANGWVCPMQTWAQALTGEHGRWVRDIYWVPERWLRLIPWTYGPSYLVGVAAVWWRIKRRAAS